MKKVYNNYKVVVCSKNGIDERVMVSGIGVIKSDMKTFTFVEAKRSGRNHNPVVYDGRFFRVRKTSCGLRFTGIFTEEALARATARTKADIVKDIERGIKEVVEIINN